MLVTESSPNGAGDEAAPDSFAGVMEAWRGHLGLGHDAFARRVHISPGYWSQLRAGQRRPSRALVEALLGRADFREWFARVFVVRSPAAAPGRGEVAA